MRCTLKPGPAAEGLADGLGTALTWPRVAWSTRVARRAPAARRPAGTRSGRRTTGCAPSGSPGSRERRRRRRGRAPAAAAAGAKDASKTAKAAAPKAAAKAAPKA